MQAKEIKRNVARWLIVRDQYVLLVQSTSGAWKFPGGGQEEGENIKQAGRRELLEETGLSLIGWVVCAFVQQETIGVGNPVLRHGLKVGDVQNVNYLYPRGLLTGRIRPGGDVVGVEWCSVETARSKLTYPAQKYVLEDFLK